MESRHSASSPTAMGYPLRSPRPQPHGAAARISRLWALVVLALVLLVAFVSRHRQRSGGGGGGGVGARPGAWVRTSAGTKRLVPPPAAAPVGREVDSVSARAGRDGGDADPSRAGEGEGAVGVVERLLNALWGGAAPPTSASSSSPGAAAQRRRDSGPLSARRELIESEPIHVAYTACGYPSESEDDMFGLVSLKSLLMTRAMAANQQQDEEDEEDEEGRGRRGGRRKYVFHIMTSMSYADLFNTTALNWEVYRALQADRDWLEVRVYTLEDMDRAGRELGFTDTDIIPHTVFKMCAASRLKLPFVLRRENVQRVIYLDWDTVVTCDLTRLWGRFAEWDERAWVGFALNDPTGLSEKDIYKLNNIRRHPLGAVSSGLMMMDVGRMAADGDRLLRLYWDVVVGIVRKAVPAEELAKADFWVLTKAFPLGDQDILNALLADHPEILFLVPPEYNWCLADLVPFVELRRARFKRPLPCVHHFCGQRLFSDSMKQEGSPDDRHVRAIYEYFRRAPLMPPEPPPGPWTPPQRAA